MRLRDVMNVQVVTVSPDDSASDALALMRQHRIRHLVVVEGRETVGIISERDLGGTRLAASARGRTVRELMTPDPVSASPSTTLRQAANLMRGRTIGCILVVEEGQVVGIVTTTDVLDQLGRGATRAEVSIERPPVRRPPSSGLVRGKRAPKGPTGPRGGRRPRPAPAQRAVRVRPAGRIPTSPPPVHIRVLGAALDSEDRDRITLKLGRRLGKFASSIQRATVRLSDINGPKGGVDHKCVIKVVLNGLPTVVVERRDSVLQRAVNDAIDATVLSVRRSVQRRRLKPLRRRAQPVSAAS